jgi:hypothetical protein
MSKSKTRFQEKWMSEIDPPGHHPCGVGRVLMSIMPIALSVERNLDVTKGVSYS